MEANVRVLYSYLFPVEWENQLERKLDCIAGDNKGYWDDCLLMLNRMSSFEEIDITKIVDRYGRTCLHLLASNVYNPNKGCWSSCDEAVNNIKLLLQFPGGMDLLDVSDQLGFTAFDCAIMNKNYAVAKLLSSMGANPIAGICSGESSDIDKVVQEFHERAFEEKVMQDIFKFQEDYSSPVGDDVEVQRLKSQHISEQGLLDAISQFEQWFKTPTGTSVNGRKFLCEEWMCYF